MSIVFAVLQRKIVVFLSKCLRFSPCGSKKVSFFVFFAQNEPQNQKKAVSLRRKLKIT
jgi:hypothetical protein